MHMECPRVVRLLHRLAKELHPTCRSRAPILIQAFFTKATTKQYFLADRPTLLGKLRTQPFRWLAAGGALLLLVLPLAGQIESRTEELEILRRDKVARLWPERQSEFVKLANSFVERGGLDSPGKGVNGFQPMVLGGLRAGNGFSYGIGYRRSDIWRGRIGFRVTARGTLRQAYLLSLEGEFPQMNSDRAFVDYSITYENSPQMDYYGPGVDSDKANRTSGLSQR
jgi:hypothetical protein